MFLFNKLFYKQMHVIIQPVQILSVKTVNLHLKMSMEKTKKKYKEINIYWKEEEELG